MKSIDIDLENHRMLEKYRQSFDESYNDILKRILSSYENSDKLVIKSFSIVNENKNSLLQKGLFWKGYLLKNGLKLRSHYKGALYTAEVANGKIIYNDNEHTSPSSAAVEAASGVAVNGWKFWEYYNEETKQWEMLDSLRLKQ